MTGAQFLIGAVLLLLALLALEAWVTLRDAR